MDDSLRYSTDKVAIVREARKRGRIIREWAPALALTEEEALALARAAGIVRR